MTPLAERDEESEGAVSPQFLWSTAGLLAAIGTAAAASAGPGGPPRLCPLCTGPASGFSVLRINRKSTAAIIRS